MCDYRLELVASRPAKVGDKLISAGFPHTISRGFASLDEPKVAVCLLPGTQLAFEDEVRCEAGIVFSRKLGHRRVSDRSTGLSRTVITTRLSCLTGRSSC
jgi:hypothetical protein